MLTDEVNIKVSGGKGGNGIVAFNKIKMNLGPTGGKGGDGGNVKFIGISDVFALNKFRHQKKFTALNGKDGKGNKKDGASGKDLILTIPIGTVIHNLNEGKDYEITQIGQEKIIARGGKGGRGNFYFRSSLNTTPRECEEGKLGEKFNLKLELRLIADVGLIGLPSAGKSSLLNELTAANAKVGAYHFTTLEPNLGVMDKIIIADIPGLIEGASRGKGLGIKFLRHIQRTKILIHCLSLESTNLWQDYKIIRQELKSYNPELTKKEELILLTKTDLMEEEYQERKIKKFKEKLKARKKILTVSIYDWDALMYLRQEINKLLR